MKAITMHLPLSKREMLLYQARTMAMLARVTRQRHYLERARKASNALKQYDKLTLIKGGLYG